MDGLGCRATAAQGLNANRTSYTGPLVHWFSHSKHTRRDSPPRESILLPCFPFL
jgi:hypothetical protein